MTHRQVFSPLRLTARALSVGRGETVLGRDIALGVASGGGLLLRGANGAGKSTLLLTLAGLLAPLEGDVLIEGLDEDFGPARHYCGHRNAVRPRLTVGETLDFWAAINGASGLSTAEALEKVGIARLGGVDAGYLSAGQQRRLALARLLVSARPVWLLDEPTAALDAEGHRLLAALLRDHLASGGLAVIATHDDIVVDGFETFTLGVAA
ncbi:MAG: heme ABC exporter ATP-binding protein CcmA [Devosia sp.]|nr:heme ABC exporter ATP-binding protein CcmA [Devosia sp.]